MSKKILVFIIILLVVLLLGSFVCSYYLYNQNKELEEELYDVQEVVRADNSKKIDDYEEMGHIVITKIGLESVYVDANGDFSCVNNHICNFADSNGSSKSFVLGALSTTGKYFARLDELKVGDMAYISNSDEEYDVELFDISYPDKTSGAVTAKDGAFVTLFTPDKTEPDKKYLALSFKLVKNSDNLAGSVSSSDNVAEDE